jgi:hypothetical protein
MSSEAIATDATDATDATKTAKAAKPESLMDARKEVLIANILEFIKSSIPSLTETQTRAWWAEGVYTDQIGHGLANHATVVLDILQEALALGLKADASVLVEDDGTARVPMLFTPEELMSVQDFFGTQFFELYLKHGPFDLVDEEFKNPYTVKPSTSADKMSTDITVVSRSATDVVSRDMSVPSGISVHFIEDDDEESEDLAKPPVAAAELAAKTRDNAQSDRVEEAADYARESLAASPGRKRKDSEGERPSKRVIAE